MSHVPSPNPSRRWLPAGLWCGLSLLTSCALLYGDEGLDVVESGSAIGASQVPSAVGRLKYARLVQSQLGEPWLAIATDGLSAGKVSEERTELAMVQLSAPYEKRSLPIYSFLFPNTEVPSALCYQSPRSDGQSTVTLLRPGEPPLVELSARDDQRIFKRPRYLCGNHTLISWSTPSGPQRIDVVMVQPDGTQLRKVLPWPLEARTENDQGPQELDADENALVVIDGDYHTLITHLDSGYTADLGFVYWGGFAGGRYVFLDENGLLNAYSLSERTQRPFGAELSPDGGLIGFDKRRSEILSCDWNGLRAIALPIAKGPMTGSSRQRVLDAAPCGPSGLSLGPVTDTALYASGHSYRRVRLDGSKPPELFVLLNDDGSPQVDVRAQCSDKWLAYTLDPKDRYGEGVGDVWIGGRRFAERARDIRGSADCQRLHYKEFAANLRKLGELRSTVVPALDSTEPLERPLRLAQSVGYYGETGDGRILAAADLAVTGPHNRLLLIDIESRRARPLVHGMGTVLNALFVGSSLPDRREVAVEVIDPDFEGPRSLMLLTLPPRSQPTAADTGE